MYILFCYYFKCRRVKLISCLTFCEFRKNDSTKEKEKAILRSLTPSRKSENIAGPFLNFSWRIVRTFDVSNDPSALFRL